jgi:hypothetical protein
MSKNASSILYTSSAGVNDASNYMSGAEVIVDGGIYGCM